VATVALGTAEDDLNIASVGHDQTALGEAAAALLVSHRRREAVLAMQQEWDLGDNQMVDALQRRLDAASPRVRLRVASVPGDPELAAGVLTAALASQGTSPTLLCRSGQMALRAAQIAARQRLRPAQTMLVALGSDGVGRQAPAMPIHAPNVDDREVGQAAANLLTAQWNAGRPLRQRVNLLHHLHLVGA
jgi:DNA-binding LacI/PurR family transcriptional regulator